jgi:23S rRNA pseudouridine955/2504/2580 synthase
MLSYTITASDHCRSVDSFLRNLLPLATAGYLHKLLKNGHLGLNGSPAQGDDLLRLGDELSLKESAKTASLLQKRLSPLDILHEDDHILVVNKEPGLAVHRAAEDGDRNLVTLAERHLAQRGVVCKLRPVNRIDRGTTGGVILAKSSTAAGMFGRYVRETGLGKIYLAAVSGRLGDEGVIDLPLDGKESLTHYRILSRGKRASIAAVYPVSGRMHQIRRHLAAVGHPILGDIRYGGPALDDYAGTGLHAFAVALRHPADDRDLVIRAPLSTGLCSLLSGIAGGDWPALLATLPDLPLQLSASSGGCS